MTLYAAIGIGCIFPAMVIGVVAAIFNPPDWRAVWCGWFHRRHRVPDPGAVSMSGHRYVMPYRCTRCGEDRRQVIGRQPNDKEAARA